MEKAQLTLDGKNIELPIVKGTENEKAIDVLAKISEAKKNYILLTNAPRPNSIVKIFLEKMGMNKNMRENVYTSGEAALSYLKKKLSGAKFLSYWTSKRF